MGKYLSVCSMKTMYNQNYPAEFPAIALKWLSSL